MLEKHLFVLKVKNCEAAHLKSKVQSCTPLIGLKINCQKKNCSFGSVPAKKHTFYISDTCHGPLATHCLNLWWKGTFLERSHMDHVNILALVIYWNWDYVRPKGIDQRQGASMKHYGVSALGNGQLLFNVLTDTIELLNLKKNPLKMT